MSDPRTKLQALFEEPHRFANYGEVLIRLHVRGFRCHANTAVDVMSPITAFCGLNGTGKSTLLQLAAACYRAPDATTQTYYIKDFLVVSTLDPAPFAEEATVEARFWQEDRKTRPLTLSRNARTKRWQGYKRRPERPVFFAGIGLYLPKIEQRDFITRNATRLTIAETTIVAESIRSACCRVVGQPYNRVLSNRVRYSGHEGVIISVERQGTAYSEAHMGYGEGRSQYLVTHLETLPDRTLVLIEEPETSLHASAQHELGRYLVDVAVRRRHQVLLTTHSEPLLDALPSLSRVFLTRGHAGVETIAGLSAAEAQSLMSQGRTKALVVLVEDPVGRAVLREILRRADPNLLDCISIHVAGGAEQIKQAMKTLAGAKLRLAAVRDADKPEVPKENLFRLPGSAPPEVEMLGAAAVTAHIREHYHFDLDGFRASLGAADHHAWFELLAGRLNCDEAALVAEAARVYVRALPETEVAPLVTLLREAARA